MQLQRRKSSPWSKITSVSFTLYLTKLWNREQKLHFFYFGKSNGRASNDTSSMKTHGQNNLIITEKSNINHFNGFAPVYLSSTNATKLICIHSHNTFMKVKSKTRHLYLHAEHWQRKHWKENCQCNKPQQNQFIAAQPTTQDKSKFLKWS